MGLAGIDDASSWASDSRPSLTAFGGSVRSVRGLGWRDRGHRRGLHELESDAACAGNTDRLKVRSLHTAPR
jgi:hypothetical protein